MASTIFSLFLLFSLFLFFLSSLVNLVDSRIGVDTFQQHMTILSKNDAMLTAKRREPSLAAPKLSAGGWVGGWVGGVGGLGGWVGGWVYDPAFRSVAVSFFCFRRDCLWIFVIRPGLPRSR